MTLFFEPRDISFKFPRRRQSLLVFVACSRNSSHTVSSPKSFLARVKLHSSSTDHVRACIYPLIGKLNKMCHLLLHVWDGMRGLFCRISWHNCVSENKYSVYAWSHIRISQSLISIRFLAIFALPLTRLMLVKRSIYYVPRWSRNRGCVRRFRKFSLLTKSHENRDRSRDKVKL